MTKSGWAPLALALLAVAGGSTAAMAAVTPIAMTVAGEATAGAFGRSLTDTAGAAVTLGGGWTYAVTSARLVPGGEEASLTPSATVEAGTSTGARWLTPGIGEVNGVWGWEVVNTTGSAATGARPLWRYRFVADAAAVFRMNFLVFTVGGNAGLNPLRLVVNGDDIYGSPAPNAPDPAANGALDVPLAAGQSYDIALWNRGAITDAGPQTARGVFLNAWEILPAAVPEPGSWALLIAGFGLTGAALRRRRAVPA